MGNIEQSTIIVVIGIVAGPLLAYLSARSASKQASVAADVASAIEFNKVLVARVDNLEEKVEGLTKANSEALSLQRYAFSYIERLLLHMIELLNLRDIPPIPEQLQEHITVKLPEAP